MPKPKRVTIDAILTPQESDEIPIAQATLAAEGLPAPSSRKNERKTPKMQSMG